MRPTPSRCSTLSLFSQSSPVCRHALHCLFPRAALYRVVRGRPRPGRRIRWIAAMHASQKTDPISSPGHLAADMLPHKPVTISPFDGMCRRSRWRVSSGERCALHCPAKLPCTAAAFPFAPHGYAVRPICSAAVVDTPRKAKTGSPPPIVICLTPRTCSPIVVEQAPRALA